jgi:SNF2 family DNA or RNA helicase
MFIVAKSRQKLLIDPVVFKKVDHNHFDTKKIIEFKDRKWVVLPFNEHTNAVLTRYALNAPAPIEHYYNWPGRYKPFKHQYETAKFLAAHPRCFCLNEMGTGKTLATLWAADFLLTRGLHKSVLIISPLSTIDSVWGDTLFESFHHRSYEVLHGSTTKRLEALSRPAQFYIINHDGIKMPEVLDALKKRSDISLVICDEFAVFRNHSTQRYKSLWTLAGPDTKKSLWALTGAPMPKAPTDIWAQAKMVNPTLVPKYFSRFRNELMIKISNFKWIPKAGWETKCYAMLKPSIRYTTDQCLDLPPMTYMDHIVALSKEQKKAYDSMVAHYKVEAAQGKIVAANSAVKLSKLLQIACGAVYTNEGQSVWLNPQPKLTELENIIDETLRKCIVFAPFKSIIDQLHSEVAKMGFKTAKIYGDTSIGKRNTIFKDFQHENLEVLVAHPQCMAHGVTLTSSSTIVWFGPIDNFEVYEQANARIRRAGQTKHQNIIHLQASAVEKLVYAKLKNKEKTQDVLLELLKSN